MRAVVNEACGMTTMVYVVVADAQGASPQSLENPQGERSRPEYRDPEKGDGGGTSSRRDE